MAKEHYIPERSGQNMKNIATNKDTYHQAAGLLRSMLQIYHNLCVTSVIFN